MGGRTSLTVNPGMIAMKENAFIEVKNRNSSITAELESGRSGVIIAQGGYAKGDNEFTDNQEGHDRGEVGGV